MFTCDLKLSTLLRNYRLESLFVSNCALNGWSFLVDYCLGFLRDELDLAGIKLRDTFSFDIFSSPNDSPEILKSMFSLMPASVTSF